MKPTRRPNRLVRQTLIIEETASMFFMLLTFASVIVGIVGRFIFNHPFIWSEELPAILILWSVYLMLGVNYQHRDYLTIDVILEKAPAGVRKVFRLISETITFVTAVFVIFFGIVAFNTNFVSKTMSLNVSVSLTNYLTVIIGTVSVVFFMLLKCLTRQKGEGQ